MHLTTERLILRDVIETDWQPMMTNALPDEVRRFRADETPTEARYREIVSSIMQANAQTPRASYYLAITDRTTHAYLGGVKLVLDEDAQQAEVGYTLGMPQWGKGYATEAARAVMAFGFGELTLHRLYADVIAENTASVRVLEKLGMRREAHFHENTYFRGRWWDMYLYALLDREWRA